MKIIDFLYAKLICWKYRLHWEEIKFTKWPKIVYIKSTKDYVVFCPYCGEYVCSDGTCSNGLCPETMD